jgi:tetratricopeptide (TPR) repeat protein
VVARAATSLVGLDGPYPGVPQESERWAALARATIKRMGGDSRLESWLENDTGIARWGQGRLSEAERALERSISLKEQLLGSDHVDVAASLNNLAMVLLDLGQPLKALSYADRAVEIARSWAASSFVAMFVESRSDALLALNRVDEAEGGYRESLQLVEKLASSNGLLSEAGAESVRGIGRVKVRRGQPKEALPYFERALRLQRNGDSRFQIADTKFDLARARDTVAPGDVRALSLARDAESTYSGAPAFDRKRAEVAAWIAAHAPSKASDL